MMASVIPLMAAADRTTVERRFEFANLPQGWSTVIGILAVLVLCWAVIWMYRREQRRGASARVRLVLAALRCTVILALAAIWLQPVLATFVHRWIDSYCLLLVDDSSSMDLGDRYREADVAARVRAVMMGPGPSDLGIPVRRADLAATLLGRGREGEDAPAAPGLLARLAERNRVKLYTFADQPKLLATLRAAREGQDAEGSGESTSDDGRGAADFSPRGLKSAARPAAELAGLIFEAQGPATNASAAVRRTVESLGSAPLAGVVLLTDGGFNQGDPVDVLGRYVEERRIPLHVIGIGDASPPRNVRVAQVAAPDNVFKEDPFAVTAHITTQGMSGEDISVELYERGAADSGQGLPVARRTVTVSPDGTVEPVVFSRRRDTIGRSVYRVVVPPGVPESVTDDNSKQATVNVIDDQMRVLLISGGPSWEYRYLQRLLTRDETFDVSCWLQSADAKAVRDGNTIIDHLPAEPEELFEYDAVVLMDSDPSEFGPGWARTLETLVTDHGGGLLYVASRKFASRFMRDPAVRRIVQMLPVTPDPEADLILNAVGHYQTRAWAIEIPTAAFGHPILSGGADASAGRARWQNMTGVYWHYPVLREKPVATVLMRHSSPQMRNSYGGHVLLATQFVGAGRTAFLASDTTWRWRHHGEEVYNAFWVQMLRYLVEGKLLGGKKRATILTEAETFQLGDAITVTARLYDARFAPLQAESVAATFGIGPQRQNFELAPLADRPGWYEGRFTPVQSGGYEISLTLPGSSAAEAVTATQQVQVVRPNIEILNPQMNRPVLEALAARSAEGRYYEIDELDQLVGAIPDRHESTTIKSRPSNLWDRWWTLAGLLVLLSAEWGLRKWSKLL